MLRVVGGSLRGRSFAMPQKGVRPTANRVREALFNILGQDMSGRQVLDLFAGSGALGIESLSRGAAQACFVEKNARNARVIDKNLRDLGLEKRACLQVADALKSLPKSWPRRFDFVFADPPYAELPAAAFWVRVLQNHVKDAGVLIVEHASRVQLNAFELDESIKDFTIKAELRRYGDSSLSLLTKM